MRDDDVNWNDLDSSITRRQTYRKPKLPSFEGTDFKLWRIEVEAILKSGLYHETIIAQTIRNCSKDSARNILLTIDPSATSKEIQSKLADMFERLPQTITLKPMETKTARGFIRKIRTVDAAVTEPVEDTYIQKALVCARAVELGKFARVPVRICNMSAKIMEIPVKSELCQLSEVNVLRNADLCTPHTEYNHDETLVSNQQILTCTNEDTPVDNLPCTSGIPTSPPHIPPYLPESAKNPTALTESEIENKYEDESYNLKKDFGVALDEVTLSG
ncbi:hypothetical protein DPMN_147482 [Dreissena polymorpha]|uniref:Uncharacterized protein n=1 Tax=Dreissena polymorpha TaxID=45954 RepID=A0A9D4J306_DREPO|nr:hypothetical protein DPMN_147482 [Dreissena polymorpha]